MAYRRTRNRSILTGYFDRSGGSPGCRIPAPVNSYFMIRILVDGVDYVSIGIGLLGGPSKSVDLHAGRQMQSTTGRRRPTGWQSGKGARQRGVDIPNSLDHCTCVRIIRGVMDEAIRIAIPHRTSVSVTNDHRHICRTRAILRGGDGSKRSRHRLDLGSS